MERRKGNALDNKNMPDEKREQLPDSTERGRRFPLVLPEEELPLRSRPNVTEADLEKCGNPERTRPSVDPETIYADTERKVYEGRITGQMHSMDSTAAPIRFRAAEENAASGTERDTQTKASEKEELPRKKKPVPAKKREQKNAPYGKDSGGAKTKKAEPTPKKASALLPVSLKKKKLSVKGILLLILFVLILFAAGYGMFRIGSVNRPANPEETNSVETNSVETEEETEPPETDSVETDPVETEPQETDPAETLPPETEAKETELVLYTVRVEAYGREPVTETTDSVTVAEFLGTLGFTLTENDRLEIPEDTRIESDMVIVINHVEYRSEQTSGPIAHTTETREVQTIPRGETKVVQPGEDGIVTVSYQVEYVNGEEVSREAVGETVTKEPIPEITEIGVGGELVGADGKTYTYSYMRVVSATYYRLEGPTWLGHDASENTVAANLNNLPLGTKLYVKSGAYDFGPRTVEDTGTVEGHDILLWIPENSPLMEAFAENRYLSDIVIYYLD